ncbi:MAG: hypothetical protein ACRYF1_20465 [Janthinobacterium lividum]
MKSSAVSLVICAMLGLVPASASVAAPAAAAAKAGIVCESFMKDFPGNMPGNRVSFERPLTIARGFGDIMSGVDVRVLSSDTKVDGTLKCRDDTFLRFELRATLPADAKILADLDKFEQAALMAGFHWDRAKAQTVVKAMTSDADEYYRASVQRGDLYDSGKVEYHQADRIDLGLIWTATDHTFVISTQTDE